MTQLLKEGQKVTIHSLGPNYPVFNPTGTIVGLAVNDVVKIYIVKLDKLEDLSSDYSCIVIPESCLKW